MNPSYAAPRPPYAMHPFREAYRARPPHPPRTGNANAPAPTLPTFNGITPTHSAPITPTETVPTIHATPAQNTVPTLPVPVPLPLPLPTEATVATPITVPLPLPLAPPQPLTQPTAPPEI